MSDRDVGSGRRGLSDDNDGEPGADEAVYGYITAHRGRAAVRGVFWSALNTLMPTVLSGLVFIVTSRYLLPKDFGLVALTTSIVAFGSGFGPTAFGEALIQQRVIRKGHLDSVFWLAAGSASIIYATLIALGPLLSRSIGQADIAWLLPIIGLKVFFDFLAIVPNALISRTMSFHLVAMRTGIATTVSAIVSITLILAGWGVKAIAFAQIASSVASCVAAYWGAGWLPGVKISISRLRDLAKYGIYASANRFLYTMNLDQLIIGTAISPAALGIYNFARRLLQMLNDIVAGGLTSVTHVLLSSLQGDQAKVREAFLMATFGCSLVSFPAFLGLAAVAPDLIRVVFGEHWLPAVWPVRFFCVIGVMMSIGVIQASLITSQGKSNWWFYYQLVRNGLTVLTIIVLREAGVAHIVFALMAGVLLLWPVTLVMTSKLIGLSGYFIQFVRPLVSALAMLASVALVGRLLDGEPPVLRLLVEVGCGAAVHGLAILLLCRRRIMTLWSTVRTKRAAGRPA